VLLNAHFIYFFFYYFVHLLLLLFLRMSEAAAAFAFQQERPPWTGNGTHARSRARGSQCKAGVLKISLYDYHNNTTFCFPGFASLSQAL
jgi:hypothetical protein